MERQRKKRLSEPDLEVVTAQDSEQLSLFSLLPEGVQQKRYSNLFTFYDSIPRYFWGKAQRTKEGLLPVLTRSFTTPAGERCKMVVKPAVVEVKDSKKGESSFISRYPGLREEMVEDALIKLVSEGKGAFINKEAAVLASLNEIRKELKNRGHNYKISEIKEAISVMTSATIMVEPEASDDFEKMEFSIIASYALANRKDFMEGKGSDYGYIVFNDLVKSGLKAGDYRLYNYAISMSYKKPLARWIHKRMAARFRQASILNPYTILASTILENSGVTINSEFRLNLRQIRQAMEELKEKKVITSCAEKHITGGKKGSKIIDTKLTLTPHPEFIRDVKKANKFEGDVASKIPMQSLLPGLQSPDQK